ncbi:MAG: Ni/Fe-hydrogenase cytochrome b subunit [Pseudomonadota bacterium]
MDGKPVGGKILTKPFLFFAAIILAFAGLTVIRFIFGIGKISNLSDGYPWGIWIAYDVVTGTAIACGGYAMALIVYVLNKGRYHPLVRPAVLTSMFGYTLAGVSVFIDIGRYWNAYNLFTPWNANPNSIMFEVAMCIGSYVFILWFEFAPVFLEGISKHKEYLPSFVRNWKVDGIQKVLNKVIFVFIAIGVLLPTMHQSSLGTLMVISGKKLHPLWQTGLLPLLFLICALFMGYAIVIFEAILSAVGFRREIEMPMLSKLSGIVPWIIGVFLSIRFFDLLMRGALGMAFKFDLYSIAFIVENLLYFYPLLALASSRNRTKPRTLFLASISLLLAGSLYRFNTYLVGFNPGSNWSYFPSLSELIVTFGIIGVEIMAYLYIVKKFPVLIADEQHA